MVARMRGSVINISSLLLFEGGIRMQAYAAVKHTIAGLTKALASGKGIDLGFSERDGSFLRGSFVEFALRVPDAV